MSRKARTHRKIATMSSPKAGFYTGMAYAVGRTKYTKAAGHFSTRTPIVKALAVGTVAGVSHAGYKRRYGNRSV